jgi:hypothetical protein
MKNCVIKAALSLSIFCGVLMMARSANALWNPSFYLKNYNSGLCLAAWGGSMSPGTPIIQWDCDHTESQVWMWLPYSSPTPQIVNFFNQDKCIGVEGASTELRAPLILWDCNGSSDQKWWFAEQPAYSMPGAGDCYMIKNINSGMIMAVPLSSTQPGETIIQYGTYAAPTPDMFWCIVAPAY